MSAPAKILALLDAPPTPGARQRLCSRCESLAAHARKAGFADPPVHEVESWTQFSVRYYGAFCRECADWEWSAHWNARYEAAAEDLLQREELDRELRARIARGRRFWPAARFTHPKR